MSIGYNGTASGEDNCCEDENFATKPSVIHAEDNAMRKLEDDLPSMRDASMFVTTAPCLNCAHMIVERGFKSVYYRNQYRTIEGLRYLTDNGIDVQHLQETE